MSERFHAQGWGNLTPGRGRVDRGRTPDDDVRAVSSAMESVARALGKQRS